MAEEHKDQHGGEQGEGHGGGHGGGGHGAGSHGGGHGGGEHEESGAPEWLISFADNVALLMGFFVILLAMNMVKPKAGGIGGENKYPSAEDSRMIDFVIEMRKAFHSPIDINSKDPALAPIIKRMKQRAQQGETTEPGPEGTKKNNQAIEPSEYVNLTGVVPFPEFASTVSPEGSETLRQLAEKLTGIKWIIEVRGHVSAAEAAAGNNRGMDLAFTRASACATELVNTGLKWAQLRVVACGDNERRTPLARDKAAHQSNQRVEVVITKETIAEDPYTEQGR